ncbi:MAG: IgGFc-binding protein [Nannocystaceae bacterium]|nr:IgGFc-binding protein [Nannocystaceae bacterium]
MRASQRPLTLLIATAALGCGEVEEGNAPPLPGASGTSGVSAGPGGPPLPDPTAATAGSDGTPAHCRSHDQDAPTSTGSTTDDGGFKFDVGAPDGGVTFEFGCDEADAFSTNLGCEFWAVDLPNDDRGTFMSPPAADQQFSVAVGNPSGLAAAQIDVYLPGEEIPFAMALVEPRQTHTFTLPSASIEPNFGTADGLAYRISSNTPIVAYQFNPLDNTTEVYSNDASLLLPTHALGDDYVAVTGSAILLSQGPADTSPRNAGAFVSVIATQDGTQVEIEPTAPLAGGTTKTKVMGEGQVWTIISTQGTGETGNLSGTRVTANAPVAVFAGNVATIEPLEAGECCADHLEHQLSPRTAWSSRYAVAPPPSVAGDGGDDPALYRITGSFNGTQLLYCPAKPDGAPTQIDAGETLEFQTDDPFTIASADPEHAFGLAQFLLSNQLLPGEGVGDPAMMVVPSALQFESRLAFVVPAGYIETHISVVAQGSGTVTLNGDDIPDKSFTPLGVLDGEPFRYAQLPVDEGQHIIEARGRVGVSVFGYDEAVSFAYPGGAGLRVVSVPPAAG